MTKRTKHIERKEFQRMPRWIRSQDYRLINLAEKDLLAYLYRFEPKPCQLTNRQLAEKFCVPNRTIQRRLKNLKKLKHIRIENPGTIHRLIHITGIGKISEK